jgi:hypothetical protein
MMTKILMWEKPEKAMDLEAWQNIAADSAPPGVYTPNMSEDDMLRWKAKFVGAKAGSPRVEIRKTAYAQMLIIVSLGGGFQQQYKSMPEWANVQISLNAAACLDWQDLADMNTAIQEAKDFLEAYALKAGK